ncbi:sialidase family protein [Kordiimonas aestuarii]|uniref:sialidase family protein n=1 Tax=Kordiimonas aestuarii TaxID=1005925 RepID=UPI0021CF6F0D|nr:sialidase family protein [Kordiimonas aestuarii]
MGLRIIRHQTLYRDERFYSAFPNVLALPSGDVLLAFRRAPDHRWMLGEAAEVERDSVDHWHFRSHIAMLRFDGGLQERVGARGLPTYAEAGDQDANLFLTSTGRLLQYGFLWYPVTNEIADKLKDQGFAPVTKEHLGAGYIYWASYVRYSEDEGQSWSDHILLPDEPTSGPRTMKYRPQSAPVRGRMIERSDGSLLIAGYAGNVKGQDLPVIRFFESRDDGVSWSVPDTMIAMADVTLVEPALAAWPAGKVTAFHRTGHNDDRLVIAASSDEGRNFGPAETVNVKGHPYDPLNLPDGRLLLVYGYRHDPMGVRARVVAEGQDIADTEEFVIRDDSLSRDTGYPSATILPSGQILIAYYIADERGLRGIEGTIIEID